MRRGTGRVLLRRSEREAIYGPDPTLPRRTECLVKTSLHSGCPDRRVSPALAQRSDGYGDAPGRPRLHGATRSRSVIKQRRPAAYVRDLLRDDQSSSALSARNVFTGHPDPRQAQDDYNAEVRAPEMPAPPSARMWVTRLSLRSAHVVQQRFSIQRASLGSSGACGCGASARDRTARSSASP